MGKELIGDGTAGGGGLGIDSSLILVAPILSTNNIVVESTSLLTETNAFGFSEWTVCSTVCGADG